MKTNLRIIIPVYNEESRVKQSLKSVFDFYIHSKRDLNLKQIIIINDGSKDNSNNVIQKLIKDKMFTHNFNKIVYINLKTNIGKARAVETALKEIPEDVRPNSLIKMQDSDLLGITWKHIANEIYPMLKNRNIAMSMSFVPGSNIRLMYLWRYEFAKIIAKRGGAITGQRTLHFVDFKQSFSLLPKDNNCYQLEPTLSFVVHKKVKKLKRLRYSFHLLTGVSHIPKIEKQDNILKSSFKYLNQAAQLVFNYGTMPIKYFFRRTKRQ